MVGEGGRKSKVNSTCTTGLNFPRKRVSHRGAAKGRGGAWPAPGCCQECQYRLSDYWQYLLLLNLVD